MKYPIEVHDNYFHPYLLQGGQYCRHFGLSHLSKYNTYFYFIHPYLYTQSTFQYQIATIKLDNCFLSTP